jgi:hypothetical protein
MRKMIVRKYFSVWAAAALLLVSAACGRRIDYELPESPVAFHTGSFVNPADSDDTYLSIEYNGRTYIVYGTLKSSVHGGDVGKCLGYVVQDGGVREDERIFLLNADPAANYLVRFCVGGFMEQPDFFRALDTKGKMINTPPFIESLKYSFWAE